MDIRAPGRTSRFLSGLCRAFTWKKPCTSLPSPVEKVLTDLAEKAEAAVEKVEAEVIEKVESLVAEVGEKAPEIAEKVKEEVIEKITELVEKVKAKDMAAVAAATALPESEDDKEKSSA